jgi:hypothetical protein
MHSSNQSCGRAEALPTQTLSNNVKEQN